MRVQIYNSLSRFLIKSEDFLLENEVVNNYFGKYWLRAKRRKRQINGQVM